MQPSTVRGVIALEFLKKKLKLNDLQSAFSAMKYIKNDQNESAPALSLLIWHAKRVENMDMAFKALEEFNRFKIHPSCVKDLNESLLQKGSYELSIQLHALYPQAFTEDNSYYDVIYYAHNHQIDKAIQLTYLISDNLEKRYALEQILKNENISEKNRHIIDCLIEDSYN